jgi:hypothetical protein
MRNLYDSLNWTTLLATLMIGVSAISIQVQAQAQAAKPAAAQAQPGERKKSLSFEDELVEGATQKPEMFYLFQKKNFNYKRLIKLRENFLPEMRKTSEDLQRVRSSN